MKKKRISVVLPKNAVKEIRENMLTEGYSLREKSKWLSEAIQDFLALNDYHDLVEMAELVDDLENTDAFYITPELEEKLEDAIIDVRKKHPAIEGVKSLIVRASIVRRLVVSGRNK